MKSEQGYSPGEGIVTRDSNHGAETNTKIMQKNAKTTHPKVELQKTCNMDACGRGK